METTIKEIIDYVQSTGGLYSDWYCGIATNPRERLFEKHNVDQNDYWIFNECASTDIARAVEKYLLQMGFDGGPGGGDQSTVFVYAYKKTPYTKE